MVEGSFQPNLLTNSSGISFNSAAAFSRVRVRKSLRGRNRVIRMMHGRPFVKRASAKLFRVAGKTGSADKTNTVARKEIAIQ